MARDLLRVALNLDHIHCYDEGDGWGDAEPYLWTVFFKIDGDTASLTESLTLSGTATVVGTPGSHGNLGTSDVDAGDNVSIPAAIGQWDTLLKPIPVPASLKPLVDDVAGVVGVVCILMEEDNVSDAGANAGHAALNGAVQSALDDVVATTSFSHQQPTDEEMAAYKAAIMQAVKDAIQNEQNFFENVWSWLNADDQIGSEFFQWGHDDLAGGVSINFSKRWPNEGDWELFGNITSSVACTAEALAAAAGIFGAIFGRSASEMRSFRDSRFGPDNYLQRWWDVAERNTPHLMYALERDPELKKSGAALLQGVGDLLGNPRAPLDMEQLGHMERLLRALHASGSRRARIDASRALDVLPHLAGRTVEESIHLLGAVNPARNPRPLRDVSPLIDPKLPHPSSLSKPVERGRFRPPIKVGGAMEREQYGPPIKVGGGMEPGKGPTDAAGILRRGRDYLAKGDVEGLKDLVSPDFVNHGSTRGDLRGHGSFERLVEMLRAGFSDVEGQLLEVVQQGDLAAFRYHWSGTHTGEFFGLQPTGQRVDTDGLDMIRVRDGKVVEYWPGGIQMLNLMRQLGKVTSQS